MPRRARISRSRKASLLPLQLAVPDPSGWSFGLNPAMPGLADLFNSGRAADRRERRPAHRARDARAVPEPLRPAAAAAVLPQRSAGPMAFAQGQRTFEVGLGRAHRRRAEQPPREPATRAERVACRGRRCFRPAWRPCPTRWRGAGPTAFAAFPATGEAPARRQAFQAVADASYDTVYERAFATCTSAPCCSATRCPRRSRPRPSSRRCRAILRPRYPALRRSCEPSRS